MLEKVYLIADAPFLYAFKIPNACDYCEAERNRRMAKPFTRKLYASRAWRDCRDGYSKSVNGICERCGQPGIEVHHKKPITPMNIDDPDIVYNWNNLELLCRSCHIDAHDKKKNLRRPARESDLRYMFDEHGNPVPRGMVNVVWGSPASGKTTYVREHMEHMDIVVDLDDILQCFTGLTNKTDNPNNIKDYLSFALSVRDAVYKVIASGGHGVRTAWIIAGLPKRRDRIALQQRFNAKLIHIDCTCDEALQRAADDDSRPNKQHMENIIVDYFRNLEA